MVLLIAGSVSSWGKHITVTVEAGEYLENGSIFRQYLVTESFGLSGKKAKELDEANYAKLREVNLPGRFHAARQYRVSEEKLEGVGYLWRSYRPWDLYLNQISAVEIGFHAERVRKESDYRIWPFRAPVQELDSSDWKSILEGIESRAAALVMKLSASKPPPRLIAQEWLEPFAAGQPPARRRIEMTFDVD